MCIGLRGTGQQFRVGVLMSAEADMGRRCLYMIAAFDTASGVNQAGQDVTTVEFKSSKTPLMGREDARLTQPRV